MASLVRSTPTLRTNRKRTKRPTRRGIWLWKDIGFQGMVYVDKETAYMRLLEPFLQKKKVSSTHSR
jgi:hypothetical protein